MNRSGWSIGKLRKGRLLRVVAVLLLLHAGGDLAFPELCSEEPFGAGLSQAFELSSRANSNESSLALAVAASRESKDEERPDPYPQDEDCFCCCTHVMPSASFVAPKDAEEGSTISSRQNSSIPSTPPNRPYHPPRFA
jgi:hypothetical protein